MKITKAKSLENRARVVETAGALFRERGYDGVSVADLMSAAGLTHGGFYKHFGSKAELIAEASERGLTQKILDYQGIDLVNMVRSYISREHRDGRAEGCTLAALCSDAARQPASVQAAFEDGISRMLAAVGDTAVTAGADERTVRTQAIGMFAQMVGALVLSRSCPDDSPLVDEILQVCRDQTLAALTHQGNA